jgi:hypothetical protein
MTVAASFLLEAEHKLEAAAVGADRRGLPQMV